jgi:hypothetical protein
MSRNKTEQVNLSLDLKMPVVVKDRNNVFRATSDNLWNIKNATSPKISKFYHNQE